jgi:hypothetical protein
MSFKFYNLRSFGGAKIASIYSGAATSTQMMDMVLAFTASEGSPGDLMTLAKITGASKGILPGTWGSIGNSEFTGYQYTKLGSGAAYPMTAPFELPGGTTFDGTNSYSFRLDCNNTRTAEVNGYAKTWEGAALFFSGGFPERATVTAYIKLGNLAAPGFESSINNDLIELTGPKGYAVSQQVQYLGTTPNIIHGHSENELGNSIIISDREKIYELTVHQNLVDSAGEYLLLDGNNVVGASDSLLPNPEGSGSLVRMYIQNYLTNASGYIDFYAVGINWSNPMYPTRPLTIPIVTGFSVIQTNQNELHLAFESPVTRFTIEGSQDGVSWTGMQTNYRMKTVTHAKSFYVNNLASGAYNYRIKALIGNQESAWATSDAATVNNNNLHGDWLGPLTVTGAPGVLAAGELGVKLQVGNYDITITGVGGYFKGPPGDTTYGDVTMKLYNSGQSLVASGVILAASAIYDRENFIPLTYTLQSGQIYYLTRSVGGYNTFIGGATSRSINSSLATIINNVTEEFIDGGYGPFAGTVNFRY